MFKKQLCASLNLAFLLSAEKRLIIGSKAELRMLGGVWMDQVDLKLISLLQKNARLSLKQLAEQVFLSPPAVSARMARLEREGIIKGYSANIDLLKLDYRITAFINLEMTPNQKPTFYPFIAACPNVIECNCVTGNYSMLIKVAYPSTQELDVFIGQLQRFGNTQTQIVFSTPVEHRGVNIEHLTHAEPEE
jgi:Lrp/AsnC family leucine-responsive transcriptional regulator